VGSVLIARVQQEVGGNLMYTIYKSSSWIKSALLFTSFIAVFYIKLSFFKGINETYTANNVHMVTIFLLMPWRQMPPGHQQV